MKPEIEANLQATLSKIANCTNDQERAEKFANLECFLVHSDDISGAEYLLFTLGEMKGKFDLTQSMRVEKRKFR